MGHFPCLNTACRYQATGFLSPLFPSSLAFLCPSHSPLTVSKLIASRQNLAGWSKSSSYVFWALMFQKHKFSEKPQILPKKCILKKLKERTCPRLDQDPSCAWRKGEENKRKRGPWRREVHVSSVLVPPGNWMTIEGHCRNTEPSRGEENCQHLCDRDGLQNSLLDGPEVHKRVQAGWSWCTGYSQLGWW